MGALAAARTVGATEDQARLDALLTVMSTLQDTELLHTAGPLGLESMSRRAPVAVLEAGGTAALNRAAPRCTASTCTSTRARSPRGSAGLLAGRCSWTRLR
ncbi:2-(5''-triphosphoribosyl)-3'-dephosphocoenzyme-A synthase [Streptomyces alboniger]